MSLINSNLEKRKYSLATSRIEKLLQIKNTILINIKQLDNNQQKFLDELKNERFAKSKMSHSSSTIKVRPAPTPFPSTSFFTLNNNNSNNKESTITKKKVNTINNSNLNINKDSKNNFTSAKKKIINRRNRDYSLSIRDNNRSTSINNNLKEFNTISNFYKNNNNPINSFGNKKIVDELKKKLLTQKGINDKLRREIDNLKTNLNKFNYNNSNDEAYNNNLKKLSIDMSKNISFFKDKINKTSDLLFSLTFSFNSLQNKCNKLSSYNESEQDFSDIKKKIIKYRKGNI